MIMLKEKMGIVYDSTSVQLDPLPGDVLLSWVEAQNLIPDDSIYNLPDEQGRFKYGRENNPHVTLYFGMPGDVEKDKVKALLQTVGGPVWISVNELSYFRNPGKPYDIVVLPVDSQVLRAMNAVFQLHFGVPKDFPLYTPHITVAYVKKGFEIPGAAVSENRGFSRDFVISYPTVGRVSVSI